MRNQAQARRDSGMKWEWRETGNFYFAPFGQKSEGGGLAVHRLFAHNKIQAHPLIVEPLAPGDNLLDRFAVFFVSRMMRFSGCILRSSRASS
jgi:hypothetical protein